MQGSGAMAPAGPGRPRWADLRDSSNETWAGSPPHPSAPCAEPMDSYREMPDSLERDLAENSQASLNVQLKRTVATGSSQPRDFAFLIGRSSSSASPGESNELTSHEPVCPPAQLRDSNERSGASRSCSSTSLPLKCTASDAAPVVEASPLPTLAETMPNGLDGGPSDFSFLLNTRKKQHDSPRGDDVMETKAATELTPPPVTTGRRRMNRKRRHVTAQDSEKKRHCEATRSGDEMVASSEIAQGGGYEDGIAVAPSNAVAEQGMSDQSAAQQSPEESMLHRLEKRQTLIEIIKQSPEYCSFAEHRSREEQSAPSAPKTPDATDRAISKRRWEEEVRLWRLALRKWSPEFGMEEPPSN